MEHWAAKENLTVKYYCIILKKLADSSSQELDFIDEYLHNFADELEDLITEDIRIRIDSIL